MKLPSHVVVKISPDDMMSFLGLIESKGYYDTFLQIVRPGQLFGRVIKTKINGIAAEHHIRGYTDGSISSEYEFPRTDQMWQHLTTRSYSAHETVIKYLKQIKIPFEVDENIRYLYNDTIPQEFPKDYMEFFRWLFIGVLFWSVLGYLWRFYYKIKISNSREVKSTIDEILIIDRNSSPLNAPALIASPLKKKEVHYVINESKTWNR